jgi:hypothetical protein
MTRHAGVLVRRRSWLVGLVALTVAAAALAGASQRARSDGVRHDAGATAGVAASPAAATAGPAVLHDVRHLPVYDRWDTFTTADGLPSGKVFTIRIDGARVWAGTDKGLARYEHGRWTVLGPADGLPHPVVLAVDVSPLTGDVWIGTMGGLARYSAGRIDAFTQLNSGLSNDFVNDVECDPEEPHVWVATAMGVNRLDLTTGTWTVFTEENTPMHEPWTYSVAADRGVIWVGAWGAGVLEYEKASGRWRPFRDPDKEMEIDLLPDDGPVHDVTSAVDFREGVLWQSSYFGLARYDGRRWSTYFMEDSGLASNFVNFVRARGRIAWLCTDDGLSATDGERWVTYRRRPNGSGELTRFTGSRETNRQRLATALAHNYVFGIDFDGDDIWVATSDGVSRGRSSSPREMTLERRRDTAHR